MAHGTHYDVTGNGPAVILIHGLGLNRHMWQWQRDALASHFRVVDYDLLGHGESPKPRGPIPMASMVDQLAALMDSLGIERAAVIGFSLGGLIARAFALAKPDAVNALVILNSAHARTSSDRADIMQRVNQVEEHGPAATVADALARWFTPAFAQANPQVLETVHDWIVANDRTAYPAVYRLLATADIGLETAIADIFQPTLIVASEEDAGNSPHMARQMAALMPDARVEILAGLRHMALAEDPGQVNALLLAFLKNHLPEKC